MKPILGRNLRVDKRGDNIVLVNADTGRVVFRLSETDVTVTSEMGDAVRAHVSFICLEP